MADDSKNQMADDSKNQMAEDSKTRGQRADERNQGHGRCTQRDRIYLTKRGMRKAGMF
jgi:hypothetical protein